ncbi:hypothetical protein [Bacillus sp. XF8]|uniref:hypothetical protein n=1 Tax=Bacillus sp. XF8 TaxID=2819289 RepID=UPI001AA087E5|nr:hypothetical protein [Bacillus sp. XF8]MBO1581610.1 hypothetical protein [Bacillus sp. XF8]
MKRIKNIIASQRVQMILLCISVLGMLFLLWFTIWTSLFSTDPAEEIKAEQIKERQQERVKMLEKHFE